MKGLYSLMSHWFKNRGAAGSEGPQIWGRLKLPTSAWTVGFYGRKLAFSVPILLYLLSLANAPGTKHSWDRLVESPPELSTLTFTALFSLLVRLFAANFLDSLFGKQSIWKRF